jgi:hypothetical protein
MKSIKKIIFASSLLSFLIASHCYAACGFNITLNAINQTWTPSFNYIAVTLTLQKASPIACTADITFGKGHAANYTRYVLNSSTNELDYQLFGDSGLTHILKDAPDVTSINDVLSYTFSSAPNQSQTLTYYFQIPQLTATSPTYKPYGGYSDNVVVRVYENTSGNPSSIASVNTTAPVTSTLNINIQIQQIIELCFGTASSGFNPSNLTQTLNFGDVTTSKTQTSNILVLSNAGYAISLTSTNGGVLKNTSAPSSPSIPYTLSFNGSALPLSTSPALGVSKSTITTANGDSYPISITTTTTNNVLTGNFSDSISITAITTE